MLSLAETRDRALSFSREVDFMRWFLVALLTIGVVIATRAGLEPFQYLLLLANCVSNIVVVYLSFIVCILNYLYVVKFQIKTELN